MDSPLCLSGHTNSITIKGVTVKDHTTKTNSDRVKGVHVPTPPRTRHTTHRGT